MNKFFNYTVHHPWQIVIVTLLLYFAAHSGIDGLVARSDFKAFVDPNYPGLHELEELEAIFSENNNAFIAIAPKDGAVFTPQNLAIVREFTQAAWQIPFAQRVDSLTNFQYTDVDGDDLVVRELVPLDQPINRIIVKNAKRISNAEPALAGLFISEKNDVTSVNITFQFQYQKLASVELAESGEALYNLVEDFEARYPNVAFYPSGSIVVDYFSDVCHLEVSEFIAPAMLLLMGFLLLVLLRSFWGTACTAVIVILTGSITMGIFGWIRLEIDGMSAISPIVIMTLAVADSVHIISGVLSGLSEGKDKISAILYSLKLNFTPVFLTSLTTVLGVITFTFTDFPSLKKMGMIIALGVTIAFILSVTLLPAILALSPIKALKHNSQRNRVFVAIGEWVIQYHRKILPVAILICLGCSALVPTLRVNESMTDAFDESTSAYKSSHFISKHLAGSQILDIAVIADKPGSINDPKMLAMLEAFTVWARSQPEILHVTTITDTFKRLNQNMHGNDPEWYRLPEEQALSAQYLLLYEMSLPYGLDLTNQINLDKSGARITLMVDDIMSGEIVDLQNRIKAWFDENSPDTRNMSASMSSLMAEISYLHLLPKMLQGAIIAIFTVSLVLFFALRNWRFGILGMLTNIVPIAMGYGLWAITHGMVGFAVASVGGICLGIVVDFAVHFLNKFQQGLKLTGTTEGGVRYAFEKVASPLWTTMIVLTSGFWVLTLSPFNFISDLGLLTGVIIVMALFMNLLTLPSLLLYFSKSVSKMNTQN